MATSRIFQSFWSTPSTVNKNNRVKIQMQGKTVSQRINSFFKRYFDLVYIGMCARFAVAAAKYTPPNMGKAYIDTKYYYRPIQDLRALAKGQIPHNHASKKDYQMLRNGFNFRVMNTKYRHPRSEAVYAYCKGINEAKRVSRIAMRGLSKYSWGGMLNNTEEDIKNFSSNGDSFKVNSKGFGGLGIYKFNNLPPIFTRLAKKSPAITRLQWGSYDVQYNPSRSKPSKINFIVRNRLAEIQRYGVYAVQAGLIEAKKYAEKVFKGLGTIGANVGMNPALLPNASQEAIEAEKIRQDLGRLFDTEIKKYGIQQLGVKGPKGKSFSSSNVTILPPK